MCKTQQPDSKISETARRTSAALLTIWDSDHNEDRRPNELVQTCRENLKILTQSPSRTPDDILEKGRVLALLTSCDYLPDQLYLLTQSILRDMKNLGKT